MTYRLYLLFMFIMVLVLKASICAAYIVLSDASLECLIVYIFHSMQATLNHPKLMLSLRRVIFGHLLGHRKRQVPSFFTEIKIVNFCFKFGICLF